MGHVHGGKRKDLDDGKAKTWADFLRESGNDEDLAEAAWDLAEDVEDTAAAVGGLSLSGGQAAQQLAQAEAARRARAAAQPEEQREDELVCPSTLNEFIQYYGGSAEFPPPGVARRHRPPARCQPTSRRHSTLSQRSLCAGSLFCSRCACGSLGALRVALKQTLSHAASVDALPSTRSSLRRLSALTTTSLRELSLRALY